MSLEACAEIVRRGDPDRFLATMAAPIAARVYLFPLYAFNVEIARAPWVTPEPMIAEMRLQWWRDALGELDQGKPPRAHEVMAPLADVIRTARLKTDLLDQMIEARRWDIHDEPFKGADAFEAYLDRTAANLMWVSAQALGAAPEAEILVRACGRAAGLAAFFQAVPELRARGRIPLIDDSEAAISALAYQGLQDIAQARQHRDTIAPAAAPALLSGWQTETILRRVARRPQLVLAGGLASSEFAKRGRLLWHSMTGRW